MGLTSTKRQVFKSDLPLFQGKKVSEASSIELFNWTAKKAINCFMFIEEFDNGKLTLCNSLGDFISYESEDK